MEPARPPQPWPGADIVLEARRRAACYADDWRDGIQARTRILAPSTYIFLASLLPALAFGLQLDSDTEGVLGVVQVLAATAITGVVQAVVGGQPLLIVGVAEPVVLIYGFMYDWAGGQAGLGRGRFLAWAAWVCVWTAAMVLLLAASGACRWIGAFTRFSGELFGGLIGVLFLQQAVKGLIAQFRLDPNTSHSGDTAAADTYVWRVVNGLWSLLLAAGLLLSALVVVRARSWRFLNKPLRGLLADYGAPACVLVCTGISFALSPQADGAAPPGVPRRVSTGDVWGGSSGSSSTSGWRVAARMGEVPGPYIAAALLPAFVIAVLFYFDHSVSSLMAQQPEYRLARPPAFAYDLALLAAMTAGCGLLGLPPVNGVLPQAPMHTRSLATLGSRVKLNPAADKRQRRGLSHIATNGCGHQQQRYADGVLVGDEMERRHSSGLELEPAAVTAGNGHRHGSSTTAPAITATAATTHFPTAAVELTLAAAGLRPRRHLPAAAATAAAATAAGGGSSSSALTAPNASDSGGAGRPPGSPLPAALAALPHSHLQHPAAGGSVGHGGGDDQSPAAASEAAAARRRLLKGRLSTEGEGDHVRAARAAATVVSAQVDSALPLDSHGTGGGREGPPQHPPVLAVATLPADVAGALEVPPPQVAHGHALPLCVLEQRLSGLLQSLGVAACLFATPAIRQIPQAALWGYFAFMAIESFQGSQLVDRVLLLLTDPARRPALASAGPHAPYLETVPFAVTAAFTLLQVGLLAGVWALVTWAGVAGVAFPIPIMALVPLRAFVLPRLFRPEHLRELDAAEYEQVPPAPPPPPPPLTPHLLPPPPSGPAVGVQGAGGAGTLPRPLNNSHLGAELGAEDGWMGEDEEERAVCGTAGSSTVAAMLVQGAAPGGGALLSPPATAAVALLPHGAAAVMGQAAGSPDASTGNRRLAALESARGSHEQERAPPLGATSHATTSLATAAATAVVHMDWEGERGLIESEHVGMQPVHHLSRSQLRQRVAAAAAGTASSLLSGERPAAAVGAVARAAGAVNSSGSSIGSRV